MTSFIKLALKLLILSSIASSVYAQEYIEGNTRFKNEFVTISKPKIHYVDYHGTKRVSEISAVENAQSFVGVCNKSGFGEYINHKRDVNLFSGNGPVSLAYFNDAGKLIAISGGFYKLSEITCARR